MTYKEALEILQDTSKECGNEDFCRQYEECEDCPLAEAMEISYRALDAMDTIKKIIDSADGYTSKVLEIKEVLEHGENNN